MVGWQDTLLAHLRANGMEHVQLAQCTDVRYACVREGGVPWYGSGKRWRLERASAIIHASWRGHVRQSRALDTHMCAGVAVSVVQWHHYI